VTRLCIFCGQPCSAQGQGEHLFAKWLNTALPTTPADPQPEWYETDSNNGTELDHAGVDSQRGGLTDHHARVQTPEAVGGSRRSLPGRQRRSQTSGKAGRCGCEPAASKAETWEEAIERGLPAAEKQGKGRIASDEQLETIARIHAAHLLEQARNGPTKNTNQMG
jgi:hypothetical protein